MEPGSRASWWHRALEIFTDLPPDVKKGLEIVDYNASASAVLVRDTLGKFLNTEALGTNIMVIGKNGIITAENMIHHLWSKYEEVD